ncbi:MAG: glycosyltransferase family 4 protein [Acidimicrobiia bacterium]
MTRVLLVTNDWPPDVGGIQTYLAGLVARTRHDVTVLAPRRAGTPPTPGVVRHPHLRFLGPARPVREWIVSEAERAGADVIWFGAPHPPALTAPAVGAAAALPWVVQAHGAEVSVADTLPWIRGRLRRSLAGAAEVLAVSRFTADLVDRVAGRPAVALGVGVDVERFTPGPPPDRFTVLCVGRLVRRKGQDRVIGAVARLRDGGLASAEAVLVGTGPDAGRLRRLAAELEVPTAFVVASEEDLPGWYRTASAFAMPVRDRWFGREPEGLGIVYLEAAASGLPVIVGPSGGAPETVVPGRTGFVAGDVRTLARQLAWLAEHRDEAAAMGAAGRAFVTERYGWPAVMDRFDEAIERAAARPT